MIPENVINPEAARLEAEVFALVDEIESKLQALVPLVEKAQAAAGMIPAELANRIHLILPN